MFRVSMMALGCAALIGCGDKSSEETDEDLILPQAGNWTIVTTGYTNDDCNAAGFLIPPDSIAFADVDTSSFSITYYENNSRIGEGSSTCAHSSESIYDCEDIIHSTPFSSTATVSMIGVSSVTMTSETTATGVGDLVLECTGSDCNQVAAMTNTGSLPCDTTLNWTATVSE